MYSVIVVFYTVIRRHDKKSYKQNDLQGMLQLKRPVENFPLIKRLHTIIRPYKRDSMIILSMTIMLMLSMYLDGRLNTGIPYFEGMVKQIYPPELQLKKANTTETEAPFFKIYIFLLQTDLFLLKFMINAMTLILI